MTLRPPTSDLRPPTSDPPIAKEAPVVHVSHGDTRIDPYAWLRDRSDPDVLAYLDAENAYTEAVMQPTEPLRERLYAEMVGRIQETDVSVPERIDDWFYFVRTEAGLQYPILCRRAAKEGSPEEVLLDQNELARGHAYLRVGVSRVSPDHRYLAYSVDISGAETYTLYVKDLATGLLLPEQIERTAHGVEWAADNRTLFYTVLNETHRPATVYRHVLGQAPEEDVIVYHEPDEAFFLDLSKTRSRAYLILDIGSHSTSEVRYLSTDQPTEEFRLFHPRERGIEYGIAHHEDRFYVLTNEDALNFKLLATPVDQTEKAHWTPVLPHRADVKLDGIDVFRDHLVAYERSGGLQRVRVMRLSNGASHYIDFPEPVYAYRRTNNPEFDTQVVRLVYSSPVTPPTVIDYDMETRARMVRKVQEVRGGYDPSRYRTERIFATAPDGAKVPVSVVYRAPLERDGTRPLLLHGYGAYGISLDPGFSSNSLSLLDRGVVVAIAHVRGGEEMGRQWYHDGKLLKKRNTFDDFIAVAERLVADGYTASDRLAISGGSAGGLLIGAVVNRRPELFRAAVADVPFVDVLNTMLDPSLPLTVIEYDEWGDPQDPTYYAYMRGYSPYDNVAPQDYPDLLVTAGLNDPRVAFWEPAKWTARLRATKTDSNRLLLKTNMGAGHAGASGRYDFLREVAFQYAFVLEAVAERGNGGTAEA